MYYQKFFDLVGKQGLSRSDVEMVDKYLASLGLEKSKWIYPLAVSKITKIELSKVVLVLTFATTKEICSAVYLPNCPNDDNHSSFVEIEDREELGVHQSCAFCSEGGHIPDEDCDIEVVFRLKKIKGAAAAVDFFFDQNGSVEIFRPSVDNNGIPINEFEDILKKININILNNPQPVHPEIKKDIFDKFDSISSLVKYLVFLALIVAIFLRILKWEQVKAFLSVF